MLEKLLLKNFQKHSTFRAEFGPGVTSIVGRTDCGKSSVLRALRFLCLNKLGGKPDQYVTWDQDKLSVTLWVDGKKVKRVKAFKKGANTYSIDGKVYKFDSVMRKGVPAPVRAILQVDQDNFQRQLDQVFWLADGNAQVARNLNQIVNLEVMDRTAQVSQKRLRSAKARLEVSEERKKELHQECKSLEWSRAADRSLGKLERMSEELTEKRSTIEQVLKSVSTGICYQSDAVRASESLLGASNAVRAGERAIKAGERAKTLQEMIGQVVRLREAATRKIPDVSPLLGARKRLSDVAAKRTSLAATIRELETWRKQVWLSGNSLSTAEAEVRKQSRNLICPKCGQPVRTK